MLVARNQVDLVFAALAAWNISVPGYGDLEQVRRLLAADAGLDPEALGTSVSLSNLDDPQLVVLAACRAWLRGTESRDVTEILELVSDEALTRIAGWRRAVRVAFGL